MILFIFEGKREKTIYESMEALFFNSHPSEPIVRVYDGNIYDLYSTYEKYGGDMDIVSLLKDRYAKRGESIFTEETKASDFAEIYLFFDLDFHHSNKPMDELINQLQQMLTTFDNETEVGKLYISYPSIEALRYTKELPDEKFYTYVATREQSKIFKKLANDFSFYKNLSFIKYQENYSEEKGAWVKHNWQMLIKQNILKANWLCTGINELPSAVEKVSPIRIFDVQNRDYIPHNMVSVLSAFAMFLYDYFGVDVIRES